MGMTSKAEEVFNAMAHNQACAVCLATWRDHPYNGICSASCWDKWQGASYERRLVWRGRWMTFCAERGIETTRPA